MDSISGVILAGGANKRFGGKIKAKINIGSKTVISRMLDTVSEIFHEIIIVTNTPEEFTEFSQCTIIPDEFLKIGPLGGIHAAMKFSACDAIFVFAGDMPLVRKQLIVSQMEYYNEHDYEVVTPRIDNYIEPLHSIYRSSILRKVENYISEKSNHALWEFFSQLNVGYFDPGNPGEARNAFQNVNTALDIIIVEKIMRERN